MTDDLDNIYPGSPKQQFYLTFHRIIQFLWEICYFPLLPEVREYGSSKMERSRASVSQPTIQMEIEYYCKNFKHKIGFITWLRSTGICNQLIRIYMRVNNHFQNVYISFT